MKKTFTNTITLFLLLFLTGLSSAQVSQNGQLQVSGNQIVNRSGSVVSFAGPSLFWSNAGDCSAPTFYSDVAISRFKSEWNAGIVRAAYAGYMGDEAANKARVRAAVEAAIANDMYVIIDWHDHHAEDHRDQATAFFGEMARDYGVYDNVVFEIYNEPLNIAWSTIQWYASKVMTEIRKHSDNLVIVGTSNWSQDVDKVVGNKINDPNCAYAFHFYASDNWHQDGLRQKARTALAGDVPIVVTEWGTCQASGDGYIDEARVATWVQFMKDNNLTNLSWSANDKGESASYFNGGTNGASANWSLKQSGVLCKDIIQNWDGACVDCGDDCANAAAFNVNTVIEAEDYCKMSGIKVEDCIEGGQNIGYIDQGDWFSYKVNIPETKSYKIDFRLASLAGSSFQIERKDNGQVLANILVPATADWQAWQTVSENVQLEEGIYELIFKSTQADGWNINWFEVSAESTGFVLNISTSSCGSVTIEPVKSKYAEGDVVTVTANAFSGASFIEWQGDAAGTNASIQISMNADKNIVANFTGSCGSNDVYPFGLLPSNANTAEAQSAYVTFMNKFFEDCGDGKGRIKWGLPENGWENPDLSVSEGIAYGMLYAAYFNDQAKFDKLWAFYNAFPDANGLMHWQTSGCNSVVQQNAATDAEVDAAMALIVADSKWGNYRSDAEWLIAKIKTHEVESGTNVLKPGDVFGGSQITNISYFAPGYFKTFGQYTNDVAFWNGVVDKCYQIIDNNLSANNAVGGIVSDWCTANGTQAAGKSLDYSYDACRTPWRIAVDYLWYGDSRAKEYLEKSNQFIQSVGGITEVVDGYKQNGSLIEGDRYHNTTFVSTFACAGVVLSDVADINAYYTEIGVPSIVSYFDYCFDLFSRMLLSGVFQNPTYEPGKVALSVAVNGSGQVILDPPGGLYDIGTVVTVTAEGDDFIGWSGASSSSASTISIVMDANKNLTATFQGGGDEGCENPVVKSVPFSHDGKTEHCWVTSDAIDYINSWAAEKVEINGEDITNIWVNSFPAKQDGNYYIYFKGFEPWAHIEVTSPNKNAKLSETTRIKPITKAVAYPNPLRSGKLTILSSDDLFGASIKIMDLNSRQVLNIENVNSKRIEISKTHFKPGFYFIEIDNGINTQTLKIVVE